MSKVLKPLQEEVFHQNNPYLHRVFDPVQSEKNKRSAENPDFLF